METGEVEKCVAVDVKLANKLRSNDSVRQFLIVSKCECIYKYTERCIAGNKEVINKHYLARKKLEATIPIAFKLAIITKPIATAKQRK